MTEYIDELVLGPDTTIQILEVRAKFSINIFFNTGDLECISHGYCLCQSFNGKLLPELS